jgi:branched-chain amino acid transport system substrate-binding protein
MAAIFAEMWEHVSANLTVGCLWNDDRQGHFLRHPRYGFLPAAASHGHTMIDSGGYHEPANGFGQHIAQFLNAGVDVVAYAGTPEDLALFCRQAARRALHPKLITSSRWLAYPHRSLCHTSIATVVYWTPRHPFRSSLDGTSTAELAQAYEQASGNHWLQPPGLAYALIEWPLTPCRSLMTPPTAPWSRRPSGEPACTPSLGCWTGPLGQSRTSPSCA